MGTAAWQLASAVPNWSVAQVVTVGTVVSRPKNGVLRVSVWATPVVKVSTAAWQVALAVPNWLVAQVVRVGTVMSRSMKEALQVLVLPLVSKARMVTVLVPRPTRVPRIGLWVIVVALQL